MDLPPPGLTPGEPRRDGPVGRSPLVHLARALMPRAWAGEDITDDIDALLAQARADDDLDGECACLYMRASVASLDQDPTRHRTATDALVQRAHEVGLPVWESVARGILVQTLLGDGHHGLALDELVEAEMLTDGAPSSVVLATAFNALAGAYSAIDLYEDAERLYGQLSQMDVPDLESWAVQAQVYNRLFNQVIWVLALLRAGHEGAAVDRAAQAAAQLDVHEDRLRGSALWDDVLALRLFTDLITARTDAQTGSQLLQQLTGRGSVNFVGVVHCALAHRFADDGEMAAARHQVTTGLQAVDVVEGEAETTALLWQRARIAWLADPDHPGIADVWAYARRSADRVWQLRLTRRDAARDRLRAQRLRRSHRAAEREAMEDALTGVGNRRRLDLERRALRDDVLDDAVTVAYVDIDDFKGVNDSHGHEVGDRALRVLANILSQHVRTDDVVVRYGGDEFVIISRGCGAADAILLGKRILDAVRTHSWTTIHPALDLRVSIGMATGEQNHDHLFAAADAALYRAKQAGRDQVHYASLAGSRRDG